MTADFITVTDAIVADLQTNVSSLSASSANVHKYTPWDPEALQPDVTRQWAVWPAGAAESAESLDSHDHLLRQVYEVLVWESAADEERLKRDEAAAATFLQLQNDIRARFYVDANQQIGASLQVWYKGVEFGTASQRVRWMLMRLERLMPITFTST